MFWVYNLFHINGKLNIPTIELTCIQYLKKNFTEVFVLHVIACNCDYKNVEEEYNNKILKNLFGIK